MYNSLYCETHGPPDRRRRLRTGGISVVKNTRTFAHDRIQPMGIAKVQCIVITILVCGAFGAEAAATAPATEGLPEFNATVSRLGDSFSGKPLPQFIPLTVEDIAVSSDGIVATNGNYTRSLETLRSFPLEMPGKLAADHGDNVWVIQGQGADAATARPAS